MISLFPVFFFVALTLWCVFFLFFFNLLGLENSAHVLEQGGKMYSATLGLVDIVRGTNSYYKLQLLEDDVQKRSVGGNISSLSSH